MYCRATLTIRTELNNLVLENFHFMYDRLPWANCSVARIHVAECSREYYIFVKDPEGNNDQSFENNLCLSSIVEALGVGRI